MSEWQNIDTAPKREWFGEEGIRALVATADGQVYVAERLCVYPDGSIGGSIPAHHGRLTDWGVTHWMPLPDPPVPPERAPGA